MSDDIRFDEAEYKLNNCLRITLNVETYMVEVMSHNDVYEEVHKYVADLIKYLKENK